MRTWMVILLILSLFDVTLTYDGQRIDLMSFVRILVLILFCTNY